MNPLHLSQQPNPHSGEVIQDDETLGVKNKVMGHLRTSAVLASVSRVCSFIGAPLFAGSGAMAIGAAVTAVSSGTGTAGFLTALGTAAGGAAAGAAAAIPVLGVLAAGIAFLGIAVAADYVSSRIWQGSNFDNLELNARSTAHHLVQEIKANNICIQPEKAQESARSDGKSWAASVQERRATAQQAVQK